LRRKRVAREGWVEGYTDEEREETMNEHENDARTPEEMERLHVLEAADASRARKKGDLVVDLSGITDLDFTSLALLLTAQQRAEKEDRGVWLAGVSLTVWKALHAMGLGGFFKAFPVSREVAV
jgi:anti-anti-sigma regulatory factor